MAFPLNMLGANQLETNIRKSSSSWDKGQAVWRLKTEISSYTRSRDGWFAGAILNLFYALAVVVTCDS